MAKKKELPSVISKAVIVDHLAGMLDAKKVSVEKFLNSLIGFLTKALKEKKQVRLIGFGTFKAVKRKGRKIKNPRNPAQILNVKPATVIKFKAGKELKTV